MEPDLLHAITSEIHRATGRSVGACEARPVGGGCIHEAHVLVALTPYFVKVNTASRAGLFVAEMDALGAIAAAGAIRVPQPIVTGVHGSRSFLVLEHLALNPARDARAWESLGTQLAALHRRQSGDGTFGWHCANYIGATPQPNAHTSGWPAFWRDQRLGFQLRLAAEKGVTFAGADRLLESLPAFFRDHAPVPSLLHGDLWSGNAAFAEDDVPVIYDPAAYYGDRECDLAFTALFGGFHQRFYDAYDAAWPRSPGWRERRDLYNLYHVLNHFHLFGGGYRHQAQEMIHALNRAAAL